jgi:hypothetical protein
MRDLIVALIVRFSLRLPARKKSDAPSLTSVKIICVHGPGFGRDSRRREIPVEIGSSADAAPDSPANSSCDYAFRPSPA